MSPTFWAPSSRTDHLPARKSLPSSHASSSRRVRSSHFPLPSCWLPGSPGLSRPFRLHLHSDLL